MGRLKIALVVSGFPSKARPSHSLFNKIGAENLSKYADVTVIQLSTWKPGKKFVKKITGDNQKYIHFRVSSFPPIIISEPTVCAHYKLYEKIIARRLRDVFVDADIIHSVGAHFACVVASKLGKIFQKPHVLQLIGSDVNVILPKLKDYKCYRDFMLWTHGVACNTNELKKRFIGLMGKADFMPVIYNGVNIDRFSFVKKSYDSNSKLQFLYLGGVPKYRLDNGSRNLKGGMTLLAAWKENEDFLNERGCSLIFAGPDSDHEIPVEFVSSLKYKENVQLTGYIDHEKVRSFMRDSDIVLIPSMDEGMPNVAMEAGAMGKCIIGSNVGGLPDIVTSYENGILVKPADVNELKNAMSFIINNIQVLNEYSFRIRKIVEDKFDAKYFAPKYMELYKDAMTVTLPAQI